MKTEVVKKEVIEVLSVTITLNRDEARLLQRVLGQTSQHMLRLNLGGTVESSEAISALYDRLEEHFGHHSEWEKDSD